tara:strand:- start:180 stop:467 length:288 start_codon:yes stop_codon:yes gene_type:complete
MTNKTKTITLFYIENIVELNNDLAERGETLDHIEFKDEYKFEKNNIHIFHDMKSFTVMIKEKNKRITRVYESNYSYAKSIDDFKVAHELIHYSND